MNRRDMAALLSVASVAALFSPPDIRALCQEAHHPGPGVPPPVSPEEALARLKEGNTRFASGKSRHAHESVGLRHQLELGQHPFAIVLGCSDSRVPIELIFDQGFGDLFVVRVAGNVITDDVIGSIEYARIHLNSQLLVILGHEGCGAVTAALEARKHASSDPHGVQTLVKLIEPAIGSVDAALPMTEQLDRAVEMNVRWGLKSLNGLPEMQNVRLQSVGAVYDLDGRVLWLS